MRILKHCRESLPDLVTGQLLGMVVENRLEVTNSFPFPSTTAEDDENDNEGVQYQLDMMRLLREVNVDHLSVGWYQSTYLGSFISEELIETQFNYQKNIEESVLLVYDPLRSTQGTLAIKAYRLTQTFMDIYKDADFTPERMKQAGLTYESVLEEIPIQIHNSHLVRGLLYELEDESAKFENFDRLDVPSAAYLEKSLGFLIECVDDLTAEQNRFQFYQRQVAKVQAQQNAYLQKRKLENAQRIAQGEEPLPDEDLSTNPLFKPLAAPNRLESVLLTTQINNYCKQITQFSGQSMTKLYLAGALQK
eukprot:Opistho-2@11338